MRAGVLAAGARGSCRGGFPTHLLEDAERGPHVGHDLTLPRARGARADGGAWLRAAACARLTLLQVVVDNICGGPEHCVQEIQLQAVCAVFPWNGLIAPLLPAGVRGTHTIKCGLGVHPQHCPEWEQGATMALTRALAQQSGVGVRGVALARQQNAVHPRSHSFRACELATST